MSCPVLRGELRHGLHDLLVGLRVLAEVLEAQAREPLALVQVQEHLLLQLVLAVRDVERVVLPVQAVDDGGEARLLEVPEVGRRLARLLANDQELRVRAAEAVDHHLPLHGLDRVNDDAHR